MKDDYEKRNPFIERNHPEIPWYGYRTKNNTPTLNWKEDKFIILAILAVIVLPFVYTLYSLFIT